MTCSPAERACCPIINDVVIAATRPRSPTCLLRAKRLFRRRRVDLVDPDKTGGLGVVRPRHKRSADFGAVPAGYDTEPERLFGFDVTRRKILHEAAFSWRSVSAGRGKGFASSAIDN